MCDMYLLVDIYTLYKYKCAFYSDKSANTLVINHMSIHNMNRKCKKTRKSIERKRKFNNQKWYTAIYNNDFDQTLSTFVHL